MKEAILLVLGCVLVNNYALTAGFGLTPLMGFAKRGEKLLVLGLSVTAVMLVCAPLLWLLRGLIPGYWQVFLSVALILALVYLLQLLFGKRLGLYFPLIALNSAVLALALRAAEAESLLHAVLTALGAGLGFLLGLFLMNGLQERLQEEHMPRAFRGLPIQLLAAAIIALALTGFQFK